MPGLGMRYCELQQNETPEPCIVRIEFAKSSQADHAALVPGLRREGMRVSFQAEEMLSAYNTFRAAVELAG